MFDFKPSGFSENPDPERFLRRAGKPVAAKNLG
jgi:hypothetical protein